MRFLDLIVIVFTLIAISSMIYIQSRSSKLKDLGIHASSLVMTIYVALLILISILTASTSYIWYLMPDPDELENLRL